MGRRPEVSYRTSSAKAYEASSRLAARRTWWRVFLGRWMSQSDDGGGSEISVEGRLRASTQRPRTPGAARQQAASQGQGRSAPVQLADIEPPIVVPDFDIGPPSLSSRPPCLLLRVRTAYDADSYSVQLELTTDLPQPPVGGGILPYWLLITSIASIYNVAQNYVTLKQSKEIYSGKEEQSEFNAAFLSSAPEGMSSERNQEAPLFPTTDASDPLGWPSLRRLDRDGCRDPPARRVRHFQQGSLRPRHCRLRRRDLPLCLRVARLRHRQA